MKKQIKSFIMIALAFGFIFFPLPYFIEGPGGAIEINSLVTGEATEILDNPESAYHLTTVGFLKATPLQMLRPLFLDYYEVIEKEEMYGTIEDPESYAEVQSYLMDNSKQTAIEAAYRTAGEEVERAYLGIHVLSVIEESHFTGKLKIGDVVTHLDGKMIEKSEDFIKSIESKAINENVTLKGVREDEEFEVTGQLIELPETGQTGIGITLVDETVIKMNPELDIDSGSIGGPSAGLMFSLYIYSLLEDAGLGEGMEIAGTGTITVTGEVGRIGGIDKKIVAADEEGIEIFFAPDDELPAEAAEDYPDFESNYAVAKRTAEAIGTDMNIVPVKTLQDAIDYLNSL